MKKKSKILALIFALCLSFTTLLVGCVGGDGNKDGFDNSNSKSSSKKEQQSEKEEDDEYTKNY